MFTKNSPLCHLLRRPLAFSARAENNSGREEIENDGETLLAAEMASIGVGKAAAPRIVKLQEKILWQLRQQREKRKKDGSPGPTTQPKKPRQTGRRLKQPVSSTSGEAPGKKYTLSGGTHKTQSAGLRDVRHGREQPAH